MSSIEGSSSPQFETAIEEVRRPRKITTVSAAVAGVALSAGGCVFSPAEAPGLSNVNLAANAVADQNIEPVTTMELQPSPNIVEIEVDDASKDLMPYMDAVNDLIAEKGVELTNVQVEQSLCCPSRAAGFTGKYAHNHNVFGNDAPEGGYSAYQKHNEWRALPVWLQNQGYRTAMVGKYFNEDEIFLGENEVAQGWDLYANAVEGNVYDGFSYKFNVNGVVDKELQHSFIGDRVSEISIDWLKDMPKDQPYYMTIRPWSPHQPYTFPKRLENLYKNTQYPQTPSYNEADMSDKPSPLNTYPKLDASEQAAIDRIFRGRLRGMKVVDNMVRKVISTLKDRGELDNTYVIFTSDNGYLLGEHRLRRKYNQFKESLNVPYFVRGPGIPKGIQEDALVSNIDYAPTIADMANVNARKDVDGMSFLPLLTNTIKNWSRKYVLFSRGKVPLGAASNNSGLIEPREGLGPEYNPNDYFEGVISAEGWKMVRYRYGDRWELYDPNDKYELDNLFGPKGDEEFDSMPHKVRIAVGGLRGALKTLRDCSGKSCTITENSARR